MAEEQPLVGFEAMDRSGCGVGVRVGGEARFIQRCWGNFTFFGSDCFLSELA